MQGKLRALYETVLYENQSQEYNRLLIIHSLIFALPPIRYRALYTQKQSILTYITDYISQAKYYINKRSTA